jgi:hypothetical protein
MGDKPLEQTRETRAKIRGYLRAKSRPDEIQRELQLPRPTYYDHLRAIRREDQKYINALRGSDFASSVRLAIESLEDCVRDLYVIWHRPECKDADKIAAIELRYQIELDLLNVQRIGPASVPYARRIQRVKEFNEAIPHTEIE